MLDEDRSHLDILYNISRELAGSLELHEVLSRVLILSSRHLAAESASLIVLNEEGEPWDAVVLYQGEIASTNPQGIANILHSGLAGWVRQNRQPALIADTRQDERWLTLSYKEVIASTPKSALSVPVMIQEQVVGLLTLVHPQANYFTPEHLKLQQAIADLAGIAIHNAQLYHDLEQNRNLYQDLFEGISDPIFITSLNGRIINFNHQAIDVSGFTRRELLKTDITQLDELSETTLTNLRKEKRTYAVVAYESRLRTKGDLVVPVEVHVSWNKVRDHEYVQWIFRDINERQQLEASRDAMTAMIYHDLRSPLSNIISSLELISELLPPEQPPQVQQLLRIAGHSSAHMQRLISSLLDINRLESGQEVIKKNQSNVEQLINEAVEIITPNILSKEIEIDTLIPATVPLLDVDEDMIRRAILNLLENALKFSPPHTRITIGVKENHNQVIIFVEDQGPGIPEADRERIFDKYVRLDSAGKSRGLGLGLAFCRLAVQAHGGTIWVENVEPMGSRFVFSLPLSSPAKAL